jgi:hypothetical protein
MTHLDAYRDVLDSRIESLTRMVIRTEHKAAKELAAQDRWNRASAEKLQQTQGSEAQTAPVADGFVKDAEMFQDAYKAQQRA